MIRQNILGSPPVLHVDVLQRVLPWANMVPHHLGGVMKNWELGVPAIKMGH